VIDLRRLLLTLVFLPVLASAQSTAPLISEGIVEAPLAEVWSAWTTGEGLRAWLAPHADIDFRIGGLMRTNYNPAASLDAPDTIENRVLSFEPERMLSIQVAKAPDNFPFPTAIYAMWTVMYFDALDTERTQVRVIGLGFDTTEESQNMRAFFERGNMATIEQMQRHFAADSAAP
jgi:uncharacterized protein YndB with AHSA1/START domain